MSNLEEKLKSMEVEILHQITSQHIPMYNKSLNIQALFADLKSELKLNKKQDISYKDNRDFEALSC